MKPAPPPTRGLAGTVPNQRSREKEEIPAIWAALAAGALVVIADLVIGSNFSSLFVVMPLIAATAAGPKRTIQIGVLAVLLAVIMSIVDGVPVPGAAFRIGMVILIVVVAVTLSKERHAREKRLSDLDRFADIAQELILREIPARLANLEAAGRYVSASNVVRVGGDLYDVALTPGAVRFIIGDACGKGIAGVRLAAQVLASFREGVFVDDLSYLTKRLHDRVTAVAVEGDFVTAAVGEILEDGRLNVISCGHPDAALVREGKVIKVEPKTRMPPLGIGAGSGGGGSAEAQLQPGDRLMWWTDGFSEARNARKEYFEVEGALESFEEPTLGALLDRLLATVIEHSEGELSDDAALLAFEVKSTNRGQTGSR